MMTRRQKGTAIAGQLAGRGDIKVAYTGNAPAKLLADLRKMIEESRQGVAQTVNTALVWLY